MSFSVFLSYKRESEALVQSIYEALSEWGYQPWMDVHEIPKGIDEDTISWMDSIDDGLRTSRVIVGCITPKALKSPNVRQEWVWAKSASRRMIFLRLEAFDNADMPHQFAEVNYIDFVSRPSEALYELKAILDQYATSKEAQQVLKDVGWPTTERILTDLDELKNNAPNIRKRQATRAWRLLLISISIMLVVIAGIAIFNNRMILALATFLSALLALMGLFYVHDGEVELKREDNKTFMQLRDRIRRYWLEGSLRPGLEEVRALGIPLTLNTQAVFRHVEMKDTPVRHTLSIRIVYDQLKSFLIMGAPGSGKTTAMLQLALELLMDERHKNYAPFLLNLSSWRPDKTLKEWILIEGQKSYHITKKLIDLWLGNRRLMLLLDGFDEVPIEHRPALIQAINTFRSENPKLDVVIATRINEFLLATDNMQGDVLDLRGAIELKALEEHQIRSFLESDDLTGLRALYEEDDAVRELAGVPFLLNSMAYTYAGESRTALELEDKTTFARQEHLFDAYIAKRLNNPPLPKEYSLEQMREWLSWLANKLGYYGTIFRPENVTWEWFEEDERLSKIINFIQSIPHFILTFVLLGLFTILGFRTFGWLGIATIGGLGWLAVLLPFAIFISDSHHKTTYILVLDQIFELERNFSSTKDELYKFFTISCVVLIVMSLFTYFGSIVLLPSLTIVISVTLAFLVINSASVKYFRFRYILNPVKHTVIRYILVSLLIIIVMSIYQFINHLFFPIVTIMCILALTVVFIVSLKEFNAYDRTHTIPQTLISHMMFFVLYGIAWGLLTQQLLLATITIILYAFWLVPLHLGLVWNGWAYLLLYTKQPFNRNLYLDVSIKRRILRQMGGGHTFRHDSLRASLLGSSAGMEAQLLIIAQDSAKNPNARTALHSYGQRAITILINTDALNVDTRAKALEVFGDSSYTAILELLYSDNDDEFAKGISLITYYEDDRKLDHLLSLMQTEKVIRRGEVAQAFATLAEYNSLDIYLVPLLQFLVDTDDRIRWYVISKMDKIIVRQYRELLKNTNLLEITIHSLVKTSTDNEQEIRKIAIKILMSLVDKIHMEHRDFLTQAFILELHEALLHCFTNSLNDTDEEIRTLSTNALKLYIINFEDKYHEFLKPFLLQCLGDPVPTVRSVAIQALRHYKSEEMPQIFIKMVQDKDIDVCCHAIMALSDFKSNYSFGQLIKLLDSNEPAIRGHAVKVISSHENKKSVEPLIDLLNDHEEFKPIFHTNHSPMKISTIAIIALGKLKDDRAIEPVIALLDNQERWTRQTVVEQLSNFSGKQVTATFITARDDKHESVRLAVVKALGNRKNEELFELLLKMTKDQNPDVKEAAIRSIVHTEDERIIPILIDALKPNRLFRGFVIDTLGNLGDRRAVPHLINLLPRKASYTSMSSADKLIKALARIGDDRAVKPIAILLDAEAKTVQSLAYNALRHIGGEKAEATLAEWQAKQHQSQDDK